MKLCSWYREMLQKVWNRWRNPETTPTVGCRTLHDTILRLLYETGSSLTAQQIADQINTRDLYVRRKGQPLSAYEVRSRIREYSLFFRTCDDGGQETIWLSLAGEQRLKLGGQAPTFELSTVPTV